MKERVKILESIAGLADPKPPAELDEKYRKQIELMNQGREKPLSDHAVKTAIADMKKHDRYGERAIGFPRDWSFKPGDEIAIDADLAAKWEAAGICAILKPEKKAA